MKARPMIKTSERKRRGRKPIKAGFVQALPFDMPAEQVIKLAKDSGITLTRKYVFQARSRARVLSRQQAKAATKKSPLGPAEKRAREWKASLERAKPESKPEPEAAAPTVTQIVEPTFVVVPAPVPATNLESLLFAVASRLGIARTRALLDQHEQVLNLLGYGKEERVL